MKFPVLFRMLILRDITRSPVRTLLTLAGVALGIAVVVAVDLANERAIDSFNESLSLLNGSSDIQIAANGRPLDEAIIGRLAWLWDVGTMTAVVEGRAVRVDSEDPRRAEQPPAFGEQPVRLFGIDLLSDAAFRSYEPSSSRTEPRSPGIALDTSREDFMTLLVSPRQIIVPNALANEWNVAVGDEVALLVANRESTFVVHSILRDEGAARAFGGQIVFMDIAAAQLALGRFGEVDRVEIVLDDSEQTDTVIERIRVDIAPPVIAFRPEDTEDDTARMTRAFRYNLTALSYIALIVGMILVYNTMNISIARRYSEVGALRTIGTSRRTIGMLFLAESVFFGVIGGVAGVVAGEALARVAGALVSRTVAMLYTGMPGDPGSAATDPLLYIQMVVLGAGLAAISGAGPAVRASRVSPVELLRDNRSAGRSVAGWTAAGALLLVPATLLSFAPPLGGFPFPGYAAGVLFIVAFALLSPLMARAVIDNVAGLLRRLFPAEGRLAVETIRSRLPRVMVAVVSLSIAVAMLSSVAIMVASFRETVVVWLDQTLRGDLYIRPATSGADGGRNTLSADILDRLESIDGIAAIDRFRAVTIDYEGFPALMASGEFDVLSRYSGLRWLDVPDGEIDAVIQQVTSQGQVVISEPFSVRHGIGTGDTVILPTRSGSEESRVAGVFYDYSTEGGMVVMDRQVWIDRMGDDDVSNAAIYLERNADPDAVRSMIATTLGNADVRLASNGELRNQVFRVFDQTFEVTYALEVISLAVAVLGVATTLAALTLERRAELAMLRFIGASRQQLRAVIVMESGLVGLLGTLIGLLLGGVLSMLLVYVINFQSFGWTIQFAVPGFFLVQSGVVVMAATLAAGFYPATLALGSDPIEGIRAE